MAAGSEGGTAAPRKNTPTDYLFGRIIGEGEWLKGTVPWEKVSFEVLLYA